MRHIQAVREANILAGKFRTNKNVILQFTNIYGSIGRRHVQGHWGNVVPEIMHGGTPKVFLLHR